MIIKKINLEIVANNSLKNLPDNIADISLFNCLDKYTDEYNLIWVNLIYILIQLVIF